MKKLAIFTLLVAFASSTFAQSSTWTLDKVHAKMTFTVTHLMISEVDGVFKSFDAKITSSKPDFSDAVFELSANLKQVTTNNDGRDAHLQKPDMFDTAKDSTLTFKSTGISKVGDKKYKLKGDLKLKGVTKPVELDLVLIGTNVNRNKKNLAGFKASGTIKRTDFGVGGAGGAMISEEVELRASGEFVQN